jgi:hypothetical protein
MTNEGGCCAEVDLELSSATSTASRALQRTREAIVRVFFRCASDSATTDVAKKSGGKMRVSEPQVVFKSNLLQVASRTTRTGQGAFIIAARYNGQPWSRTHRKHLGPVCWVISPWMSDWCGTFWAMRAFVASLL